MSNDNHPTDLEEQAPDESLFADEVFQEDTQNTDSEGVEEGDALVRLQQENQELRDKYLRLLAEFDNFKKRNVRERIELINTAAQDTVTALLPVLDDFDRAQHLTDEQKQTPAFKEGIHLVYQKLFNVLKARGLEPMDSTGQDFDPELHSAITEIPAPTEALKGKIVDTVERGYTLRGKIIRHAKVVTGK